MEIDADLHSVLRGPLPEFHGRVDIIIAAAVAVPVLIVRVVPDPEADIVHSGLGEDLHHILLFARFIIIFDPALLFGQNTGQVHAPDEVV